MEGHRNASPVTIESTAVNRSDSKENILSTESESSDGFDITDLSSSIKAHVNPKSNKRSWDSTSSDQAMRKRRWGKNKPSELDRTNTFESLDPS